ncbi:7-cyano-7-deazaguanine synthase [Kyrpidia spormannii]|uniref:7-cyano-7-deazaguanine synthase n=1 Tax=Kyrpidia spormannii TaxID=2055160 RepID=A0ACA8Z6S3_9BACL|nr:7-cyano-7-deazaguanine synthase [Kyrpidia spormannii]
MGEKEGETRPATSRPAFSPEVEPQSPSWAPWQGPTNLGLEHRAPRAVVILSGGLDSTTCMAIADHEGYELYPITFSYGQKHALELESAKQVAAHYRVGDRHRVVDLGNFIRGSSLTDPDQSIPVGRSLEEIGTGVPSTYVPGRNTVFLSLALSFAERIDAGAIFIGVNALDYSGYPDCRPEFLQAFQRVIDTGTVAGTEGAGIRLKAPLVHLTKAEIIRWGSQLGAPYALTHSCYQGTVPACGVCDSCRLRIQGFREAGLVDPIPYAVPIAWQAGRPN